MITESNVLVLTVQVKSLQQHKSKLERQTEKQQQELMQAEQTIMSLTSSKVFATSYPCVALNGIACVAKANTSLRCRPNPCTMGRKSAHACLVTHALISQKCLAGSCLHMSSLPMSVE